MKTQFATPSKTLRGLMNEYACGCQVRYDGGVVYYICACSVHAAAPDLLAACKAALSRWKYESVGEIKMLADAVAKAEAETTKCESYRKTLQAIVEERCLRCSQRDLSWETFRQIEAARFGQTVRCRCCGHSRTDIYELVAVREEGANEPTNPR